MRFMRSGVYAILLLVLTAQLLAQSPQNTPPAPSETSPQESATPSSPQPPAEPGQAPDSQPQIRRSIYHEPRCWREAGIPPAKVNERWKIEDNAKAKINEVCSDVSLTPEKKREKIRQINEQTEQEIAKIIPAKQLAAFKACQAKRDQDKANLSRRTAQKELGPCGGIIPAQAETPAHSHEHQPNDPSHQ